MHIFDIIWRRYAYKKLGFKSEDIPIPDIRKGKIVLLPIYVYFVLEIYVG